MLHDLKELYGKKLGATDGEIGHVKDFYFDDKTWAIRYLMVDTGSWLSGREVLLSPRAFGTDGFGNPDVVGGLLRVHLKRKQIEGSPSIDSHRTVSRQYEEEFYRYYGWPGYWATDTAWSGVSLPVVAPPPPSPPLHHGHNQRDDLHLRGTKAVTGYAIHATDGEIGTVSSFMVDAKGWAIRELVVETGHWFAGKEIFVLAQNVSRISYDDAAVYVKLTKFDLAETARNAVAHPAGHR